MQKVAIKDIKVTKREREELLEIKELADSMKRFGLFNPILLDQNYTLIAGQRRLEAAKLLEWTTIAANIIPIDENITALEIEIEENIQRQQFTNEELLKAFTKLNRLQHPSIFIRILKAIINFFKKLFKK